jgi:hypothetical protein
VGVLLLLRNFDTINDDVWLELLVFFPIVLIAIGVEKIFTKSRLQLLSYATSVALMGIAFWIAAENHTGSDQGSYFESSSHTIEDNRAVSVIKANLRLSCTALTIRDSGSDLVYSRFDRFTRKPSVDFQINGDTASLTYVSRRSSYLGGAIHIEAGGDQDWDMRFSESIPLDLTCRGEDTDMHMNLSTTPVRRLTVDADETSVYIKLSDLVPEVEVRIFGDDSSLRLRVPEGIGLRFTGDEYVSYLTRMGLIERDDDLVSEGYDTASTKIDVELDGQLSSFSLDYF